MALKNTNTIVMDGGGNLGLKKSQVTTSPKAPTSTTVTNTAEIIANALKEVANTNANAAEKANNISFASQREAERFNESMATNANQVTQALLKQQQEFNAAQVEAANKLSEEYWKKSADFNREEAQKNRDWQEYMSSTAYQRAVEDLKAAGLNPILAAMNGGANMGSGAVGSVGSISGQSASINSGSGTNNSVGTFTGQMENTSNQLALFGAIYSGLSSLISNAKDAGVIEDLVEGGKNVLKAAEEVIEDTLETALVEDGGINAKMNGSYKRTWKENKKNSSKSHSR